MGYIGNTPALKYASFAVQHFTTSATTSYTLDNPVANENEIALFINNVRQEPGSSFAYTASGTTLTLSAATSASDTMYCVFIGKAVQTVTPASGSVTNDMLAGSIANAKLANSSVTVNGTSISLGASGNISAGITEADQWRVTSNFTGDNNPIASNWERADGRGQGYFGTGMSQSSGVWTFPSTGYWFVRFTLAYYASNSQSRTDISIRCSDNGTNFTEVALAQIHAHYNPVAYQSGSTETILDITDTSTHKVTFRNNDQDTSNTKLGSTDFNYTHVTFIRLGDT